MFSRRSMFRYSGAGALAALATAVFPEFGRAEAPRPERPGHGDTSRAHGYDTYGNRAYGYGVYGYGTAPYGYGSR